MALTAGFKKFLGLVAVVALVGGGIYAYKQMPKKAPEPAEQTVPQETTAQAAPPVDVQPDPAPEPEAPATPVSTKKSTAPANRGLDAVLNAGSK